MAAEVTPDLPTSSTRAGSPPRAGERRLWRLPVAPDRPLALRYAVALVLGIAGIGLTAALRPALAGSLFLLLYPAISVAAWYGGFGPGLAAGVVAVVGANMWLIPPYGQFSSGTNDLFRLGGFLVVSTLVSYLAASERTARRNADARARDASQSALELELQTVELEQQVEESQQLQEELEEQQLLLSETRDLLVLEARRLQFVSDASRILSSSLDYQITLRAVAGAFVPELSDWCAVDMIEQGEPGTWPPKVERLAVAHKDPAQVAWAWDLWRKVPIDWSAENGFPKVVRTGEAEFYPVVTEEMIVSGARDEEELALLRKIGFSALLMVPIQSGTSIIGAITLAMTESGRHYTDSDLRLAEDVARRAAVAIEHARVFADAQAARAAAEEANHAKTEFLAVMSHELRTPLNAIGGYAQLIELGIRGEVTEAQKEDLQRIQRSSRHLLSLINQILNFARIDAGQLALEPRRVPVAAALADMEALIAPQLETKRIRFEPRPPAEDVVLWCDPEKLQQILLNLLSNAVKFTPDGGTVSIRAERAGEQGAIVVQDSGAGIPREKLERVFEPFVQLDRGLTSKQEGAGLGLAISRELARAMGGDLRAEECDAGARFRLTLPLAPGGRARP